MAKIRVHQPLPLARVAFERLDPAQAQEALALMEELMAQGTDARSWGEDLA